MATTNENALLTLSYVNEEGLMENGNLIGVRVTHPGGFEMRGNIYREVPARSCLVQFPANFKAHLVDIIARKGSLYDLHVKTMGAKAAEIQPVQDIILNFITQAEYDLLDEKAQKGWQIAQRYDGPRTAENLRNLLSEDGQQLFRNYSLTIKGTNPYEDIRYMGKQIMQEPEPAKVGGNKTPKK